jgi:hypothetical protein
MPWSVDLLFSTYQYIQSYILHDLYKYENSYGSKVTKQMVTKNPPPKSILYDFNEILLNK